MRYTIQVLERATDRGWNPFSFGGGRQNGGFASDAVAKLGTIFTPHYMGAAEYEFGAFPEACDQLAQSGGETHEVELMGKPIYVFCRASDWEAIRRDMPKFVGPKSWDILRDSTLLEYALRGESPKVIGGFCLTPIPFFYFIEKGPFDQLVELFQPSTVSA